MQQQGTREARGVLVVQLALAPVLTVTALPFGLSVALSVLIGATVCLVANSVFAFQVFRQYQARDPQSLVGRFYGAELIKLSLALGLFFVAFVTIEGLSWPALLGAYFAVQVLSAVFAPDWDARQDDEKNT
ncbi:ATP synthase subunit I [Candidatus Thiosymbion oneisti]|uniref:ATP synthase subunit I n=1 Tax=Candidatus Thiosymbion oneisti TaxID=589554 RepID=UPI000B7EF17B|nr:ATP synthase subunit I [Candidatus Thiosymbion oneisti]